MHHVNTFYTHYLNDVIQDRPVDFIGVADNILPSPSPSAKQSSPQSLRANLVPTTTDENAENRTTRSAALKDLTSAAGFGDDGYSLDFNFVGNFDYANDDDDEDYADRKRAIVLISTGAKASNTTLVERFVWSARNIGNYQGWIVLITDADEERYANLAVAAMPTTTTNGVTTSRDDINNSNRYLVFRTQEKRFARITKFKKFRDTNTMNSKIFKTYILEYAKKDRRLDEIELFYYLDVDIVFGNSVRPLFDDLETRYNIGGLQQESEEGASVSLTQLPEKENTTAKIYFFKGNGSQQIQGGQIVLDRKTSQVCLERWRYLMQKQYRKKLLKDQTSLTTMLEEQKARVTTAAISNGTIITGGGTQKDCEIVLMKQDKKLIQFPELVDIQKRLAKKNKKQKEHPTLVHFRNSANVMKNVEEETFQLYVRDILRFEENQKDDLGILDKMLMDKDAKK
jgi:hypothetical protein